MIKKDIQLFKYIGLPYKNLGRDFNGIDCYGIVVLFYEQELGIKLSDYSEFLYDKEWYKEENHINNNYEKEWEVVETPSLYDGLMFSLFSNSVINHCGVYLGDDKFLHIHQGKTSNIERLNNFWNNRLNHIARCKLIEGEI